MRRNELRTARGFLEALIQVNQDCYWWIIGIVVPVISADGKTAYYRKNEKLRGGLVGSTESRTFTSDNGGLCWDAANFPHCFGWQETQHEDCHHGEMLFPIEGSSGEYLLIGFNC